MHKNNKFWILATVCFAVFTVFYAIGNGILSFVTILNFIMFIISSINLIIILRKNKKDKNK